MTVTFAQGPEMRMTGQVSAVPVLVTQPGRSAATVPSWT